MDLQLDFSSAEEQRLKITQAQQKYIRDLYKQASEEIRKMADRAPRVPSDALRKEYLNKLQGRIDKELRNIQSQLDGTVRSNMFDTVQSVVKDASDFASSIGLTIEGAYSHVPADIVQSVISGQLYTGNWSLSRALWLNTKETQQDVQSIVAKGILENRSAYDIAKDLEKYVNPDARKDWEWSKVYPGTRKVVDYNAQRLARTMVSHAYQQAFVRTTIKNPFITQYQWQAAATERTCEICMERDGQLFDKDALPLDHPNGMCTYLAVMEGSMEDAADRLADWVHGNEDPELDTWAKDLYGKDWQEKKEQASVKQSKSVFDKVKDMTKPKDMVKELNNSGWFTSKVYAGKLDAESLKHVTSAYQKVFDRYPALVGKFPAPFVGTTLNPKAYASCATSTTGQITLNRDKWVGWNTIAASWTKDVKLGFHPDGTSAESIILHEFGHSIDGWLARSGMVHSKDGYASSVLLEKAFDRSGMSTSSVGWKVSNYATKNDRECFAECFSQGMESKDPCSLTNELMRALDKLLGGK